MSDIQLVYVPFPDENTAEEIATKLLEERLIACVNLMPRGTSLYHWEGALKKSSEVVAFLKTTRAAMPQLKTFLKNHHPYASPCILALTVDEGEGDFLQWIQREVHAS